MTLSRSVQLRRASWPWSLLTCMMLAYGCAPAGNEQQNSSQTSPSSTPPGSSQPQSPRAHVDHVVIVVEENHGFNEIIGNASAPYINSLAGGGALFTNAHAVEHPSEPNYLDLFSGSNQGVTNDSCPHTFTAPNLGSALLDKQLTFSAFSEDLPSTGFAGCSSHQYARKHSPWTNFTNVTASANRPWSAFPADYNQLPTVSFVVPNLDHDMHNGTISQGDKWLKDGIDPFVQWAKTHNSLLIVTWDEDDASSENRIPMLFVGPMVKPGQYGDPINHFGVLRSIEELYGLPLLGQSASAQSVWPF